MVLNGGLCKPRGYFFFCEQLPDAVVSESVPASREEELGAWPDNPRLCRPRALLLLPRQEGESSVTGPSSLLREPKALPASSGWQGLPKAWKAGQIWGHACQRECLPKATQQAQAQRQPSNQGTPPPPRQGQMLCHLLTLLILLQAQSDGQLHHSFVIGIWGNIQHGREPLSSGQKSFQRRRVAVVHVLGRLQHHRLRLGGTKAAGVRLLLKMWPGSCEHLTALFTEGLTTISKSPWSTSFCSWLSCRMCSPLAIPELCILSSASSSS